jgi:hypothetical protein
MPILAMNSKVRNGSNLWSGQLREAATYGTCTMKQTMDHPRGVDIRNQSSAGSRPDLD